MKKKLKKVKQIVTHYNIFAYRLYKKGFFWPLLSVLEEKEAWYIMKETHRCMYISYCGARTLA